MTAPYKLLYVSYIHNDCIRSSVEMFSYGILKEFSALGIDVIELNLQSYYLQNKIGTPEIEKCIADIEAIGKVDFALCHMYYGDVDTPRIHAALQKITRFDTSVFMEVPILPWQFDKYFLFFDMPHYEHRDKYTVYNAPVLKEFYVPVEKEEKSILLDHRWTSYTDEDLEKTDMIIEAIKELSEEYTIYKMVAWNETEPVPEWITPIPNCDFQTYLKEISTKEIFISTHFGSYNSTVIDMLAYGTKCIIPKINGMTYVPHYNVDLFDLPTFSNAKELLEEIRRPLNEKILMSQIDKCTDIADIVRDIDLQFKNTIKMKDVKVLASSINKKLKTTKTIDFNSDIERIINQRGRELGSGNQCYLVMYEVAKFFNVQKMLEIGTHQGFSTIVYCQSILDNGKTPEIHTVDNWSQAQLELIAKGNIDEAGFAQYITMHSGDSLVEVPKVLKKIGKVDLAFIDGNHAIDYVVKDYNNCKSFSDVILFHDTSKGVGLEYLELAKQDGYTIYNFETQYVEGDGHLIGIALAVK